MIWRKLILIFIVIPILHTVSTEISTSADSEPEIKVRVGAYQNHPKIYFDDSGEVQGLYRDLFDAFASEQGWRIEYIPGSALDASPSTKNLF